MTYFWRLFLSVVIVLAVNIGTASAQSLSIPNTPKTAREFLQLGIERIDKGDYQEAIQILTQATKAQADYSVAFNDRCLAFLHQQQYHQAMSGDKQLRVYADCIQAINLTPNDAEVYLNRGVAYYRQGNYPAAIADHTQAIALKPSDFRAYYNRGLAFAAQGNYREAIEDYNTALTQTPRTMSVDFADIYNDRGLARLRLRELDAAMEDFNLAISLNSNDYRAYFNRGCACGKNGDHLGAVRDFSAAIRLKPSYASAYVNRGVARHRLGYHQGAIADLQTASQYFEHKGETLAYDKTLDLLKAIKQQIPTRTEVA